MLPFCVLNLLYFRRCVAKRAENSPPGPPVSRRGGRETGHRPRQWPPRPQHPGGGPSRHAELAHLRIRSVTTSGPPAVITICNRLPSQGPHHRNRKSAGHSLPAYSTERQWSRVSVVVSGPDLRSSSARACSRYVTFVIMAGT